MPAFPNHLNLQREKMTRNPLIFAAAAAAAKVIRGSTFKEKITTLTTPWRGSALKQPYHNRVAVNLQAPLN
jgi:glutaminase